LSFTGTPDIHWNAWHSLERLSFTGTPVIHWNAWHSLERLLLLPDELVQRVRFWRLGLPWYQRDALSTQRHTLEDVHLQVRLRFLVFNCLVHCLLRPKMYIDAALLLVDLPNTGNNVGWLEFGSWCLWDKYPFFPSQSSPSFEVYTVVLCKLWSFSYLLLLHVVWSRSAHAAVVAVSTGRRWCWWRSVKFLVQKPTRSSRSSSSTCWVACWSLLRSSVTLAAWSPTPTPCAQSSSTASTPSKRTSLFA